jgi:signal recognition particle receptor subunit beta
MASFDRKLQKLVVRVVYDGPGFAGKTTNLKQICASFTAQRRGEMLSPEETNGRTTLCDWLYLDGGIVGGYGLRCQLLTVPGQNVLAKRRWHILGTADVIVFVCDSTPAGVKDARVWLELLRAFLSARDLSPPLIVQANKQDVADALDMEGIVRTLDLEPGVTAVPARAASGIGVRETAVLAIRAAANLAQRRVLQVGVDGLPDADIGPDALVAALRAEPTRTPRGARRAAAPAFPAVPAVPAVSAVTAVPAVRSEPAIPAAETATPRADTAPVVTATDRDESEPPFPHAAAQSGFIWPAAAGRELLRLVARARQEEPLPVVRVGSQAKIVYRVGGWCLKTSPARRHQDADEARAALLDLARRKIQLGPLCAPDTALSLAQDERGGYWLWTVSPWLTTLEDEMRSARKSGNAGSVAEIAIAYAEGAAQALSVALRHGALAEVIPAHFGRARGRVHYLSDSIVPGSFEAAVERLVAPLGGGEPDDVCNAYLASAGRALQALDLPLSKLALELERAATERPESPLVARLASELRDAATHREDARAVATA